MHIARQIVREFWLPLVVAILWTIANIVSPLEGRWAWTKYVNIAAPTFFFVSWLTAQYFRIRKQQHVSSSLESIEQRVSDVISNLERQTSDLNYLNRSRIIQTFDECIDGLRDANEELADRSRELKSSTPVDTRVFLMQRANPFYLPSRNLNVLISYGMHVLANGQEKDLESRYTRTAHHIEELAGHVRTFIGRLNHIGYQWKTRRSRVLVHQICDQVDAFRSNLLKYSKYDTVGYKDSQDLRVVLESHVTNLRKLAS